MHNEPLAYYAVIMAIAMVVAAVVAIIAWLQEDTVEERMKKQKAELQETPSAEADVTGPRPLSLAEMAERLSPEHWLNRQLAARQQMNVQQQMTAQQVAAMSAQQEMNQQALGQLPMLARHVVVTGAGLNGGLTFAINTRGGGAGGNSSVQIGHAGSAGVAGRSSWWTQHELIRADTVRRMMGYALSPGTLQVSIIMAEPNVEIRRMMIELYGTAKFMQDSDATRLDHDERWGTLWRRGLPGDEPFVMLEVINRSPEPTGEFKHYWLRIPPDIRTSLEAVAWTFGMQPKEYAESLGAES